MIRILLELAGPEPLLYWRKEVTTPSSKAPNRKWTRSSEASCWKRPSADKPPVTRAVQHTRMMRGQGLFAASDLHRVCNKRQKVVCAMM